MHNRVRKDRSRVSINIYWLIGNGEAYFTKNYWIMKWR
jgi:hypothetical protein